MVSLHMVAITPRFDTTIAGVLLEGMAHLIASCTWLKPQFCCLQRPSPHIPKGIQPVSSQVVNNHTISQLHIVNAPTYTWVRCDIFIVWVYMGYQQATVFLGGFQPLCSYTFLCSNRFGIISPIDIMGARMYHFPYWTGFAPWFNPRVTRAAGNGVGSGVEIRGTVGDA